LSGQVIAVDKSSR